MTAFDKAREIVERIEADVASPIFTQAEVEPVARALLAYEPTPDARDAAQKIAATAFARYGFPNEPQDILARDIASAITAAVAATEARVREECAKVAENNNSWPNEGEEIAAEIRALGGAK